MRLSLQKIRTLGLIKILLVLIKKVYWCACVAVTFTTLAGGMETVLAERLHKTILNTLRWTLSIDLKKVCLLRNRLVAELFQFKYTMEKNTGNHFNSHKKPSCNSLKSSTWVSRFSSIRNDVLKTFFKQQLTNKTFSIKRE